MKSGVIWTMVGIILLELFDQGASKTYLVETKNNTNEVGDEADMLLNPEDLNNGVGGGNDYFGRRDRHWTHGIIRYEFSSRINRKTKKLALLAMKELGDKTCIKFVPRSNQRDYGKISTVDMDCGSDIGMKRGGGRRDVELSTRCKYNR